MRYYRYADLRAQFGLPFSRTHLKRLIDAGEFPAPVKLGGGHGTVAWLEADLLAYGQRIQAKRDATLTAAQRRLIDELGEGAR